MDFEQFVKKLMDDPAFRQRVRTNAEQTLIADGVSRCWLSRRWRVGHDQTPAQDKVT